MISARYAVPVIILLVLALIPTVIHSYFQARVIDGRLIDNIPTVLTGVNSNPYGRHNDDWVHDMFDSNEWIERIYKNKSGTTVRLFVASSYDHKRLYHHPELGLSHGSDFTSSDVIQLTGELNIPAFILRNSDKKRLVAYSLLYDDRFINDPIKHQLKDSFALLFNPRRQMVLFYIDAVEPDEIDEITHTDSIKLLSAAINSYLSQKMSKVNR